MYVSEKYVELIQESSRNNYPGMASDFAWGRGARIGGYVGVGIGVLVSAVTTRAYKIYKKYKLYKEKINYIKYIKRRS